MSRRTDVTIDNGGAARVFAVPMLLVAASAGGETRTVFEERNQGREGH